jgi:serine/threonine protein kinase
VSCDCDDLTIPISVRLFVTVISGARLEGFDACWSDDVEGDEAAKKYLWKIKLIDFGFARPLHPEDIEEDKLKNNNEDKPEPKDEFFGRSDIDGALLQQQQKKTPPHGQIVTKQDSLSLSNSISHQKIRGLSAVGNRNYAAPEMLKGMRAIPKKLWTAGLLSSSSSSSGGKVEKELKKKRMHRQSLADAISDYGMTADAYSVGTTLRYMLTGVPPDVSINDFMASKNSVFSKVGRSLKSLGKNKDGKKMKKRYKYTRELPSEAAKVVLGLTHWNERSRTTVRSARNYEWIKSSYFMKDEKDPISSNQHHGKINFLNCALERRV